MNIVWTEPAANRIKPLLVRDGDMLWLVLVKISESIGIEASYSPSMVKGDFTEMWNDFDSRFRAQFLQPLSEEIKDSLDDAATKVRRALARDDTSEPVMFESLELSIRANAAKIQTDQEQEG